MIFKFQRKKVDFDGWLRLLNSNQIIIFLSLFDKL